MKLNSNPMKIPITLSIKEIYQLIENFYLMLMIQLLIDIILLFIFDFDAIKKKVNFYFPFSLYENRKKSRGDYQLMFASLIIVGDIVLKSLSLIVQL